ncbi:MAG: LamG domain-containing protein, partial [Opitutae bacterium]|nr:LamG domain-containing protein [Opitutae bacterium]
DSNRFLLGSRDDYNFHANGNNYFHSSHASTAANADIRENGNSITNPSGTALPQNLSIISLRSYTDLKASNFTNDRNIGGRTWKGDLGELLIYNEALEDSEIESIEGYLAHKWGLQGALNGSHPYKSTPPDFEFGEAFVSDNGQDLEPLYYEFLHSIPAYREEDLISRWDFEEFTEDRSGLLRIRDLGPARNDGFIVGNAHLVSGKFGKALKLDGNGDYLNLPKLRGARQAQNLSFTAWINLAQTGSSDDTDDATIFSTAGLSNTHARLWYDINTDITGSRTYSLTLGSTAAVFNRTSGPAGLGVANQWQFLVGVMNEDSRTLYLNGNSIKSASSPTSSITLQGNTGRIGSWDQDDESDFHGLIDEVRIYGTSLTQSDVSSLWNSGSGDLGIIPVIAIDKNHAATEVNGTIQFFQVGNKVNVTGFDSSDLT